MVLVYKSHSVTKQSKCIHFEYLFWLWIFVCDFTFCGFFLPFFTYKHRNSFVILYFSFFSVFLDFISFFPLFPNQSIAIRLNLCNCNVFCLASPLFTVVCVCGAGDLTYLCLQTQQNKSLWNFCTYENKKSCQNIYLYIIYTQNLCVFCCCCWFAWNIQMFQLFICSHRTNISRTRTCRKHIEIFFYIHTHKNHTWIDCSYVSLVQWYAHREKLLREKWNTFCIWCNLHSK